MKTEWKFEEGPLSNHPIEKAVYQGIIKGIQITFEQACFGSCIVLIYAGMDAMARASMPPDHESATRDDFINWAKKYMHFRGTEQLTGKEFYAARCAMVHQYSVTADLNKKEPSVRQVLYKVGGSPEVVYSPEVNKSYVMVEIEGLMWAFIRGANKSLLDLMSDVNMAPIVMARLKEFVQVMPFRPD